MISPEELCTLSAQRSALTVMASLCLRPHILRNVPRLYTTASAARYMTTESANNTSEPLTHYRITSRRSAIALPKNIKGTLAALGISRRLQTVYHRHTPDIAGKILTVKELVTVENVPESAVRTKWEQRQERKASRGYSVLGSKLQSDL